MNELEKRFLEADEILKARDLNRNEQYKALCKIIQDVLTAKEKPEPRQHWPGTFNPFNTDVSPHSGVPFYILSWNSSRGFGFIEKIIPQSDRDERLAENARAMGICCETEKEAEFVKAHMEAKLAVIDRLKGLNGEWRPDWNNHSRHKWEIFIGHFNNQINISGLPDYFQAKTEKIWQQVIAEFGEEKIKLAIWPTFNPGD